MIAYKCDRCKRFFEMEKEREIELLRKTTIPLSNDTPIHLCPNCFDELKEWLKERNNEIKTSN